MRLFIVAAACLPLALPALAQNVRSTPSRTAPPTETVAPNAGAGGAAEPDPRTTARSAPTGSDNGGNLAGADVPGGVNHAPAEAAPAQSFSAPIKRD